MICMYFFVLYAFLAHGMGREARYAFSERRHRLGLRLTAVHVKSSAKGMALWTRYIASASRGATLSSLILVLPERSLISPSLVLNVQGRVQCRTYHISPARRER